MVCRSWESARGARAVDVEGVDLETIAEELQKDSRFPAGTNVHVVALQDRRTIRVAHSERGVGLHDGVRHRRRCVRRGCDRERDGFLRRLRFSCQADGSWSNGTAPAMPISPGQPCAFSIRKSISTMNLRRELSEVALAWCNVPAGQICYDPSVVPLADAGIVREALPEELIPAPQSTLEMLLPGRSPLTTIGPISGRNALAIFLSSQLHAAARARLCSAAQRAGAAALRLHVRLCRGRPFARGCDEDRREQRLEAAPLKKG